MPEQLLSNDTTFSFSCHADETNLSTLQCTTSTEFVTALISSQLELHSLSTNRKPRVITCLTLLKQHLFRHQGHLGAYLVVAGVDPTGVHLFTVHSHGSTDKLPYVTLGSGSLAAMSVFESQWKKNLTQGEAEVLCSEAILAGIFNDLGSGSNVDVCVITPEKVCSSNSPSPSGARKLTFTLFQATLKRNLLTPNERVPKEQSYKFERGATGILKEQSFSRAELKKYITIVDISGKAEGTVEGDAMDVDA